jgi:hypothetical protein
MVIIRDRQSVGPGLQSGCYYASAGVISELPTLDFEARLAETDNAFDF